MAHSPRERILDDIISGIKVDIEETEQSEEPADPLKTSNSHVQVPQKDSCPERVASLYPLKPQLDAKTEDGHSSVPLISEELPTNKSRLSPLAARAALASLVSTAHNDGANGTGLDDHHVSKTLPIMDYTSSEDPSTLEPVSGVLDVKKLSLDENPGPLNPEIEESTALKGPRARSKRSTVSTGLAKTGRVTRSSIQKANSSPMDAGAIPRSTSTDGQDCPLPSGFDDKANLTSKEGEKNVTLIQIKNSSKSNRSKPKKSTATQKQEQEQSEIEDGMGNRAQEAGDQTTTVSIDNQQIEGKRTGQSAKRKLDELQTPARVTRSAVQKSPGNAVNGDRVKSSNEGASKKRRRSTPSTGLEKTDDFTGSQGLDNDHSVHSTKADDSEMNMSQTGSVLSQKKKISPQMDLEEQTPPTKKVKAKASRSTKKAKQTEGKTTGRKGKSPEQKTKPTSGKRDKKSASNSNQRFSPRLHFLPRTRSQVKS